MTGKISDWFKQGSRLWGGKRTVKERDEDAERDGVEILQQVVWRSVQSHLAGLRDEIVPHLVPADEVERKEQEHLTLVRIDRLRGIYATSARTLQLFRPR